MKRFSKQVKRPLKLPFKPLEKPPSSSIEKLPLLKPPSSPPSTLQPSALAPSLPLRGRGLLKPPSRSSPFSSPPFAELGWSMLRESEVDSETSTVPAVTSRRRFQVFDWRSSLSEVAEWDA